MALLDQEIEECLPGVLGWVDRSGMNRLDPFLFSVSSPPSLLLFSFSCGPLRSFVLLLLVYRSRLDQSSVFWRQD